MKMSVKLNIDPF